MNETVLLGLMPYWNPLIPPMGIACLKSYLEASGVHVKVIDLNIEPQFQEIQDRYFKSLMEYIPPEKQGNSLNIGMDVISGHLMAHQNHSDKNTYNQLIKQIVYNTFFTQLTDGQVQYLSEFMETFYTQLNEYLSAILEKEKPSVLGLSVYNTTLPASLFAFKLAKQFNPTIRTVMGGGIFSGDMDIHSPNYKNFLGRTPYIDKIIVGEGEQLLLKYLRNELPPEQRVYTLENLENPVMDLSNALLPDFTGLHIPYYTMVPSYTSRSCPFNCSFCSEKVLWGKYRKKNAPQIADELEELHRLHHAQLFLMTDSLLNPVVDELSNEMIKRNLSLYWDGYLRVDEKACNPDITFQWRRGGFYRARLGLESGSPNVLEAMGKKITPAQIKNAVSSLAHAGIKTTSYWVIGHPGETEEDFQQTLDLIEEMKDDLYEADCNPFHYHLTGQVGSDQWADEKRSRLLYPEEMNEMLMLQTWVLDVPPSREEIYSRVNRFVKHCEKLGIPNPYTLQTIYQADERWKSLHVNAAPSLVEFLNVKNNAAAFIDENLKIKKIVAGTVEIKDEGDWAF